MPLMVQRPDQTPMRESIGRPASRIEPITRELRNAKVLLRFAARLLMLCAFATLGDAGFAWRVAALLWVSALICVANAVLRRESIRGTALTFWDEAAFCGLLGLLASALVRLSAA